MALSCKKGLAHTNTNKYYFIDEKFVDELSQSDNRLLVIKTPEIVSAPLIEEITRIVARTPKHNLEVTVTIVDEETHVEFKKRKKNTV